MLWNKTNWSWRTGLAVSNSSLIMEKGKRIMKGKIATIAVVNLVFGIIASIIGALIGGEGSFFLTIILFAICLVTVYMQYCILMAIAEILESQEFIRKEISQLSDKIDRNPVLNVNSKYTSNGKADLFGNKPVTREWACKSCGTLNRSTTISCRDCGTYK